MSSYQSSNRFFRIKEELDHYSSNGKHQNGSPEEEKYAPSKPKPSACPQMDNAVVNGADFVIDIIQYFFDKELVETDLNDKIKKLAANVLWEATKYSKAIDSLPAPPKDGPSESWLVSDAVQTGFRRANNNCWYKAVKAAAAKKYKSGLEIALKPQTSTSASANGPIEPLKRICGFLGPNNARIREGALRTAVQQAAVNERLNWVANNRLLRENIQGQFDHLVRYYLARFSQIFTHTFTHARDAASTNAVNYTPLLNLPANANAATVNAQITPIRNALLQGAPGLGTPRNLNGLVDEAIRLAREAHLDNDAWSGVFVVSCIRNVAIQEGLENVVNRNYSGRDELLLAHSGHRFYVEEAHRRRLGTPNQQKDGTYHAFLPTRVIQIGDIIVLDRQANRMNQVTHFNHIPGLSARGRQMHCDIVVEVNAGNAVTIGGNLGGSVRRRRYPLNNAGQLVINRTQLFAQENINTQLAAVPIVNNAAGLNDNSTGRIFAVLSPVEVCAVIPGQRVPGGVIT